MSSCSSAAIKLISCEDRSFALPPLQRKWTLIGCPLDASCTCPKRVPFGTSLDAQVRKTVPSASPRRFAVPACISLLGSRDRKKIRPLLFSSTCLPCLGNPLPRAVEQLRNMLLLLLQRLLMPIPYRNRTDQPLTPGKLTILILQKDHMERTPHRMTLAVLLLMLLMAVCLGLYFL